MNEHAPDIADRRSADDDRHCQCYFVAQLTGQSAGIDG